MRIRVDIHEHHDEKIENLLHKILRKVENMSLELDNLTAEVAENTEVIESAIVLIEGIAAQLEAITDDPVQIQALADTLNDESNKLAAAIAAHTIAE